ncbi:MAG: 16S rRNA (guanine(527)-N(7))-methyltransferase RsmG [Flavimaricola sp.]|nr:16S rRNA (guanine(527)-N(7))-methyltransferase RsmG [Flavimaricola sp.]
MKSDLETLLPGLDVSRETTNRLTVFEGLVRKWTPKINLVGPATVPDLWSRHILDSAQLFPLAPAGWHSWADLGSGGGFPGIVIAIMAADTDKSITLIESDQRKSAFLRTCVRELGLAVSVLSSRIEAVPPLSADVVSARALAPLPALIGLVQRHLASEGTALLQKGRTAADEVELARADWTFDLLSHDSQTESGARILALTRIAHV